MSESTHSKEATSSSAESDTTAQSLAMLDEQETTKSAVGKSQDTVGESLKILRVASDVYPDVMGGLSLHVHEMSRLQAEWGHDVTILTSDHGERDHPSTEERDGYELIRHREVASPLDNTITPGLVRTVWKMADDYDVIHAHSHLFFSTNVVAALSKAIETPLVVTNHGLMSQTAPKWLQKAFIPTVARFTLESADRVLCYTETDRRRLRDRDIDTEIRVIHNGIDCERFQPQDVDTGGMQILFVGRLKPGKGVDNLLTAFNEVISEYPQADLELVGDGPLREELVSQAKELGVDPNVHFRGQVENSQMPQIYSESDVFALPSMNEGLPRTVLEAMACKVPVVVSDLEQLGSVVDKAGLTVPRQNPSALCSAIKELLADTDRREEMGTVGRERVKKNHSWAETVQGTVKVYRECA